MTGEVPAKKRRRRKRRPSGGNAGPQLSQQEIIAQAVAAALAAAGVGSAAPAASSPQQQKSDLPEDKEDEAAARASIEANERKMQAVNDVAAEILPQMMAERHLIVFRWLAKERGISEADLMRQVLRAEVARETPNWREAQGLGGASTKNAATMARLKGE